MSDELDGLLNPNWPPRGAPSDSSIMADMEAAIALINADSAYRPTPRCPVDGCDLPAGHECFVRHTNARLLDYI